MCCNYYEYRLKEIGELLVAFRSKPDQFQENIEQLEKERLEILNLLNNE